MGHSSGAQTSLLGGKRVLRVGTGWVKLADSRNQVVQRASSHGPTYSLILIFSPSLSFLLPLLSLSPEVLLCLQISLASGYDPSPSLLSHLHVLYKPVPPTVLLLLI